MTTHQLSRRDILACGIGGCVLAGLVGCGHSNGSARRSSPGPSDRLGSPASGAAAASQSPGSLSPSRGRNDLAAEAAVPRTGVLQVVDPTTGDPTFLLRQAGRILCLASTCPHTGCVVAWDGAGFTCPCHGSRFDRTGRVLSPPASGSLTQRPVTVVAGRVVLG
jgi:Rieske Fe-S protein